MNNEKIFLKAGISDLIDILNIIEDARKYIKSQNFEQWQNGYPDINIIKSDIDKGNMYITKINDVIVGIGVMEYGKDENYDIIYEGKWLTDAINYLILHRFAIKEGYRKHNISSFMFENFLKIAKQSEATTIRMDTHQMNAPMNNFIIKMGFIYCGKLKIDDVIRYNAYEMVLK